MANAIPCSQFQKTSVFKYCENQHHLHVCQIVNIFNSISVNFLQFLYTTIWNDVYHHTNAQKI